MTKDIEQCFKLLENIEYNREIPKEAEEFAKTHNLIVIFGGSDDLMYCYGAKSYLTDYCEHSYGWDGDLLTNISDQKLENEAKQLGLEIYWCGLIKDKKSYNQVLKRIPDYNTKKQGAFSYKVRNNINSKDFIVLENLNDKDDVYCTGKIIELPKDFIASV